ncbi:MAG: Glycosyl transferase family 2 [Candidatus Roizmanbacteria bacterium GW2011_GWC2_37_13]|uniref:Glycosyl transferase family 2 n=1 Tax=Candidatus Roizmanbacteria bacterium GW2011_GWC2_37_13 TaxID=1618486 RepID=A0A0G0GID3_9BACT|nr:MAG: Glycosyl transferase family 2 [Candidatus Roizmanbacteria bacterium GW2011_GWC1_37_12]KKQ25875.1 MAG: Glycosyl transferase family 2 [Candidatus Roizmanbacteria bacterium GW2011_GWC2_37_13]
MRISLIIPCYNEEANIQKGVLDKIGNFTARDDRFLEVIIVDDGSSDNSKSIIKNKYLKIFPKFKLALNSHQGKAFAILTGIKNVKGDWVMFSDIDLATPIEEADKLIKETNNYQIVIGSRSSYRQGAPILRKIMAFGAIIIRNFIIGLPKIRDTQCGFKIFEKEAALKIIDKLLVFHNNRKAKGSSVSAGFDMEFLFLASKLKYDIKEIPVQWRHVETKNVNFIKDAVESLKDIFKIKLFAVLGKYDKR